MGITPTGDPSTFFVMVQDAQLRIQFPVRLPVETAEEGLLLLKDPAKMEPLVSAARQEVLKQIDEQRIRQSLANPGGMPPG
ncbi:MAG TPA: hypothetical protein VLH09_05110 [Bryobacteraceae bacterium]|nr:hypothetical protein [Bryobacteraceae bacterium]